MLNRIILAAAGIALIGSGCFGAPEYQSAPPAVPPDIEPNVEGGKASTGGYEATITPSIDTQKLAEVLPKELTSFIAGEAVEHKNPAPLPDGTATFYTSLDREYTRMVGDAPEILRITITDTRGIPVLLAFLENFTEYESDGGYRKLVLINEVSENGWWSYNYGPNKDESSGSGNFIMKHRDRFLIQIDGGSGIKADEILEAANALDLEPLR